VGNDCIAERTVLVFGGTGSLGSEIVRRCLDRGARRVIAFSRDEVKHFILRKRINDPRLETVIGDIRDLRSIERVFYHAKVDVIYHAAAMKHVTMCEREPIQAMETNVKGTQNIIDAAREHGVPTVITISTDKAAYPVNVLGASKFVAERLMFKAAQESAPAQTFACVRFGNVAVSRGSVIPVWIDNLLHAKPLQVTDCSVTRFIMDIPQAIGLVMQATEYARSGEIFILKMKAFRLSDMIEVMLNRIAPRLSIRPDDVRIEATGLIQGEKLHEDMINGLEAAHLYEMNDLYVILPDSADLRQYPGLRKSGLKSYTSDATPLISQDELEQIIRDYIRELPRSGLG
jgi:UDP-N-acetylglucosamine 4,6-dehydratase/5-epimerase